MAAYRTSGASKRAPAPSSRLGPVTPFTQTREGGSAVNHQPALRLSDPHPDCRAALRALVVGEGLTAPRDLDCFLAHAAAHGLSGLLARRCANDPHLLPEPAARAMGERWTTERLHAAMLDLELGRLLGSRGGLNLPILLKGSAVARRYGDPDVRTYVDLDLLVPRAQVGAWSATLEDLGYEGPSDWWRNHAVRYAHQLQFRRGEQDPRLLVELHTCVFFERDARHVGYEALRPSAHAHSGVLVLDAAAQLLVLGLHLAQHRLTARRLIWYRDVLEIATSEVVAEARVLAEGLRMGWAVEEALLDTEAILGEPRWDAVAQARPKMSVRRLAHSGRTGVTKHLAVARDLGPRAGPAYLLTLLDPRQFCGDGGFESEVLRRRWRSLWRTKHPSMRKRSS